MRFKLKARVVKDWDGGFRVQIKRWYWPFWLNVSYTGFEDKAKFLAEKYINPESAVVWSSDAPR